MNARDASVFEGARESAMSTCLRMVAYAITGAVFAYPLSLYPGIFAAAVAAMAGALSARWVARSSLRTAVVLSACALGIALGAALGEALGRSSLAAALGPTAALEAVEFSTFAIGGFFFALALRTVSARRRSLAALEVAVVAFAFAALVFAHRNGAIHRPYEIADPLLSRGEDPRIALFAIGAIAAMVIALLLVSERRILRAGFHLLAALLLLGFVAKGIAEEPIPVRAGSEALQTRDDDSRNRQRGGTGSPNFEDDYDEGASQTPLAVVVLHDDYSPPDGVYYFRQDAFSEYNGQRLVRATAVGIDDDVSSGFPTGTTEVQNAPPTGALRTSVETTVGMLADHSRPFGLESPFEYSALPNPDPGRFRRAYRVRSSALSSDPWALLAHRPFDSRWSEEVRTHYTKGPPDPRYAELAATIAQELPDDLREEPLARALSVTQWLGREGIYSLHSRHAGAEDPAADFLFGDRTGYCVHFAHAAVYLMRALGLPARVATGYMVPESSRRGGSAILVAGGNSHAWPEVYLEGVGWLIVDVAPQRSLDPPPPAADEQLQQLLAEMLRGLTPLPVDGSRPERPISELVESAWTMVVHGFRTALPILLLVTLLALYGWKFWRRWAPRWCSPQRLPTRAYVAALDRLSELGLRRAAGESREAFALRVGSVAPSLVGLTRAHEAAVWGSRNVPSDAKLRDAPLRVAREAGRQKRFVRRALGVCNPVSFMLTR